MTSLGDFSAAAGALFTAVAAGAAWRAARQARVAIEAAESPMLEVQVLVDASSQMLYLAIVNTGRGVARGSKYEVHAMGQTASGTLDDGFVLPGQKWRVLTAIGPFSSIGTTKDLGVAALVTHRDTAGFVHYTTDAGVTKTPKTPIRRRPRYDAGDAVFDELFPGVSRHGAHRPLASSNRRAPRERGRPE